MDLNTEDGAGLQEVYQSRHIDGSEIRLLVLRPGDGTAAVACDLITVSLDDNPIYEALSYVWGDASVRTYVELCGQLASVTINLEAALRAFRLKDCDRTIWADALCINQRDICERNDQVRMMGRIYEDAKSCIVWLGEGSKQTDLAIDAMKEFTKDPNPHWIPKTIVISGQAQEVNLEFLKSYFSGLNELFGLPWWFRVWTLQEAVLSENLTFKCGNSVFTYSEVVNFVENAAKHLHCCGGSLSNPNSDDKSLVLFFENAWDELQTLFNFRREKNDTKLRQKISDLRKLPFASQNRILHSSGELYDKVCCNIETLKEVNDRQIAQADRLKAIEYLESKKLNHVKDICEALKSLKSLATEEKEWAKKEAASKQIGDDILLTMSKETVRRCYDSRDRIYAFAGLDFNFTKISYEPRYDLPAVDVYLRFALDFIFQRKSLDILSIAWPMQSRSSRASWVPDWQKLSSLSRDQREPYGIRYNHMQKFFNSSKNKACKPSLVMEDILVVQGFVCDMVNIVGIGHDNDQLNFATRSVYKEWLELVRLNETSAAASLVDIENFRSLLFGCMPHSLPTAEFEFQQAVLALIRSETPEHQFGKHLQNTLRTGIVRMRHYTLFRKFVISKNGYMGLAPLDTQPDDKICILYGGKAAYILRPTKRQIEVDGVLKRCHILVGDAWVQGLMHSEWVDKMKQERKRSEQFFLE